MPTQIYCVEIEQEEDGRWLAEILDLPGVMAYGQSREEALANAEVLAFRVNDRQNSDHNNLDAHLAK